MYKLREKSRINTHGLAGAAGLDFLIGHPGLGPQRAVESKCVPSELLPEGNGNY